MKINKLYCHIEELIYTERIAEKHTYYTIEHKYGRKIRIKSMDYVNEDGTVEPFYCKSIAVPKPYNFEKNEMGIEAEQK